jgi:hypothetical protein
VELIAKLSGDDLFDALKSINPRISGVTDLWMNDEFLYHVDSDKGHFILSRDTWGFAFIISDDNQTCISTVDRILAQDERFKKIEVDHNKYTMSKDASR